MNYRQIVNGAVREANIVLEVIDARFPEKSRNYGLEKMVEEQGKKLLIVINKADLVSIGEARKEKELMGKKSVFVSARSRKGKTRLAKELEELAEGKEAKVAVVGYPNTGKSSIINMLAGKKSARTSPIAGFTRGKQFVRLSKKLLLIDSPGVIPFGKKDETLMALLSSKSPQQLSDLEGTGMEIAEILLAEGKLLEEHYGIRAADGEEFLEKLAMSKKKLLKKGLPDTGTAARILIRNFQEGIIRKKMGKGG